MLVLRMVELAAWLVAIVLLVRGLVLAVGMSVVVAVSAITGAE